MFYLKKCSVIINKKYEKPHRTKYKHDSYKNWFCWYYCLWVLINPLILYQEWQQSWQKFLPYTTQRLTTNFIIRYYDNNKIECLFVTLHLSLVTYFVNKGLSSRPRIQDIHPILHLQSIERFIYQDLNFNKDLVQGT